MQVVIKATTALLVAMRKMDAGPMSDTSAAHMRKTHKDMVGQQ